MKMLEKMFIMPVIGGKADDCRQVFYRKSDLLTKFEM
jgi:hypothetical protein